MVWEQGDDLWDEKDGDFPYPLGVFPPAMPLDWALGGEGPMNFTWAIFQIESLQNRHVH
jgi:hypothetical protein